MARARYQGHTMYLNGIIVPYNIISVADLGNFGGFDRTPLWAEPSSSKKY